MSKEYEDEKHKEEEKEESDGVREYSNSLAQNMNTPVSSENSDDM